MSNLHENCFKYNEFLGCPSTFVKQVEEHLVKMRAGSLAELIIANAALTALESHSNLKAYQASEEWKVFGWGRKFISNGKEIFYIKELNYPSVDFPGILYYGFQIIGKRQFKIKYKSIEHDYYCERFSKETLKDFQVIDSPVKLHKYYLENKPSK